MKLLFILIISSLLMSSCQKSYSCKCKTTIFAQYYYPYETESIEKLPKYSSKKKAAQICNNTAKQVQANARLIINSNYQVNTKCELKDY